MKLNNNDDSHNSGLNLLIYNMLLDIESHPAWVCGLKHHRGRWHEAGSEVTPCVGVWIETRTRRMRMTLPRVSHTLRGCVDWNIIGTYLFIELTVTPCVGVWIETGHTLTYDCGAEVTPCVGVWIETEQHILGNWHYTVTPCVGVWIETLGYNLRYWQWKSHPAWVCGLKRLLRINILVHACHTLRGCVDWNITIMNISRLV